MRRTAKSAQKGYHRVARQEGKIYVDLGNPSWRAVEIGSDGWRVIAEPPVCFVRPDGMQELPEPEKGGSIDALREFINVNDRQFTLVVAWLLAALGGRGPYPVLALTGEAGSAKSTTAWILRMLVDPHNFGISAPPPRTRQI